MYEVDIPLIHQTSVRFSCKEYVIKIISSKMSCYDSDEILSRVLDVLEEQEACKIGKLATYVYFRNLGKSCHVCRRRLFKTL